MKILNKKTGFTFKGYKEVLFIFSVMLTASYFGHLAVLNEPGKYVSPIPADAWEKTLTPTPTPSIPQLDPNLTEREQNIGLIQRIWGKDANVGLAIARCESGYRSGAVNYNTNHTVDQGIFQVNSVHEIPEMFDPTANVSYAYTVYLKQGTNPWTSSEHCWKGLL